LQLTAGQKGLDENGSNWGGNIYLSYDTREQDSGNEIAQGVTVNVVYLEARLGYIVNPSYNLRIEGGAILRRQTSENPNVIYSYNNSPYIYLGLRTALFNNYFDF